MLEEVGPDRHHVLHNLFQLYMYDFSEIEGAAIGDDGRYPFLDDALPVTHAYLIRAEGRIAGFALVEKRPSFWWMEEFFVMRKYRRSGVGRRAAEAVFALHPGSWELNETPNNHAATAFWRSVLERYGYEEVMVDDSKWGPRPLQRFIAP